MSDDAAESSLKRALEAATDPVSEANAHEALANHYGARCAYRAMNHHEEASAVALARAPGHEALAGAFATYERAMAAFSSRKDDEGVALLLEAVPVIRRELGELHPYARQVTNTLAGRLRSATTPDAAEARAQLRLDLLSSSERVYGPTHVNTLRAALDAGYTQHGLGRMDRAEALYARAFEGFLTMRPASEGAIGISVALNGAIDAFRALTKMFRELQRLDTIESYETKLFAAAGERVPEWTTWARRVRFERLPEEGWAFNVAAVEHAMRAVGIDEPLAREAMSVARSDAEALIAKIRATDAPEDSARAELLTAAEALVRLRMAIADEGRGRDFTNDNPATYADYAIRAMV